MSGKCYYCNKEIDKRGIKRHLNSCKQRKERIENISDNKKSDYYIIEISDKYRKSDYWMYIACHKNNTLKDIDTFLRDVWVECCGHLSEFIIDGYTFDCNADEEIDWDEFYGEEIEAEAVDVKLKDILEMGTKIKYNYDFGYTTQLEGKVVDYFKYYTEENVIEIMARHDNPEYICYNCNNIAKYIDEYGQPICGNCAEGEGEFLNELGDMSSPRSGICGYNGTRDDEREYLPKQ